MKIIQRTALYHRYKSLFLLNKNILMAGTCAFIWAAFITQFYYTQYNESHIANFIIALLSEYSVYIPIFGLLFYWDNRHRYINPLTGKKDFKIKKTDIKKLLTALSISEVSYSPVKNIHHLSISTAWSNTISDGIYVWLISTIGSNNRID